MPEAPFAQLVLDADEALHGGLAHGKPHRAFGLKCECSICAARRRHRTEGEVMHAPAYAELEFIADDELAAIVGTVIEPDPEPDDGDDEPVEPDDDE